jgi:hypothetical protein
LLRVSSLQVTHVTFGIGKVTEEPWLDRLPLAGELMGAAYDWAALLPAFSGLTFSLWPDTFPGLIYLSPYKTTPADAELLASIIERRLAQNLGMVVNLTALWSYRHAEVRLLISDGEYQTDSYVATTSTPNPAEPILLAVGATRSSTKKGWLEPLRLDYEMPPTSER